MSKGSAAASDSFAARLTINSLCRSDPWCEKGSPKRVRFFQPSLWLSGRFSFGGSGIAVNSFGHWVLEERKSEIPACFVIRTWSISRSSMISIQAKVEDSLQGWCNDWSHPEHPCAFVWTDIPLLPLAQETSGR